MKFMNIVYTHNASGQVLFQYSDEINESNDQVDVSRQAMEMFLQDHPETPLWDINIKFEHEIEKKTDG